MWQILTGMPPYPDTKNIQLAKDMIENKTAIRPYILSWFPRCLSILMQRCWQEIPEYRPTFKEIQKELELFKNELNDKNEYKKKLMNILPDKLKKTKEKLRTLYDLIYNYLDDTRYPKDRIIKEKLINLIKKYQYDKEKTVFGFIRNEKEFLQNEPFLNVIPQNIILTVLAFCVDDNVYIAFN